MRGPAYARNPLSWTWLDRVLAGALTVWALGSVLPVAVWSGTADWDFYLTQWQLWGWTLLIAVLLIAVTWLLSRGRAVAWLCAAFRRAVAVPQVPFLAMLGSLAALEAIAVAVWCFGKNPQLIDAWAQYFQARIFASGALTAPPPPSLVHFGILQLLITPHGWFSQYPPLHPLLLAVGMLAGAAWLVTPLLAALLPVTVYAGARRTGDERVARLAAALTLLSPFVVAIDASAMNHLPAALCVALGLWAVPAVASGRALHAALFGIFTGLLVGLRPLDAAALALVGAGALTGALARRAWRAVILTPLAGGAAVLPTLLFNAATTGDPFTFGYFALYGHAHALGFHPVAWGQELTPLRALGLTAGDAHQLNIYLLEWPVPVTALIAAGLWLPAQTTGNGLRGPAGFVLALVGLLFFYFHRDLLYGPRFLFSAVPAILILLAAALVRLSDLRLPITRQGTTAGDVAVLGFTVIAAFGAVQLAPQRLRSYRLTDTVLALHPDIDAQNAGIHHAVVLIPDGWGTRLIVRMWDAGVPVTESAKIYKAFNACALEERLQAAAHAGLKGAQLTAHLLSAMRAADAGRSVPGLTRDPLLRLPTDGSLSPQCASEIAWDQRGTMQFTPFLYLNAPGLDGDIVWARDMGAANALLPSLYPGRTIYRYAPAVAGGPPVFTHVFSATAARN